MLLFPADDATHFNDTRDNISGIYMRSGAPTGSESKETLWGGGSIENLHV